MIDDAVLRAIRERGARRGFVTVEDIRATLPIDEMNADEIAMIVVQLEDAGVSVELDEDLIGSSRRRGVAPQDVRAIELPGAPPGKPGATRPAPVPGVAQDAYETAEPINDTAPTGPSGWIFVAAAAGVVALGALLLLFIYR